MTLRSIRALVLVGVSLAFGSGCAAATTQQPTATASQASEWDRMELADGVELHIKPGAGPEARRVAEMIQSEMRARYIGAR